jgi:cellulose synthase/poly-beta-1,6-N-acetylglucosamine synthase-like glycosyltransferase
VLRCLLWLNVAVLCYFAIVNGMYIFLIAISGKAVGRYTRIHAVTEHESSFITTFFKPVSVIVPAHNEENTIADTVASVLAVHYPQLEVVVVNDGSTDGTMAALTEAFDLVASRVTETQSIPCAQITGVYESPQYPYLRVVDKIRGGKADALNAGVNASSFPLVCNIDADSVIDAKSLLQITRPFLEDHRVVAVGGVVFPANGCSIEAGEVLDIALPGRSLPRFQIIEYLRAFLFGRVGWARLNCLMVISGAFAIFRKAALVEVGGYRVDTVGEDMELVLRMHRIFTDRKRPYRIMFVPDPICWTQVPEDRRSLGRQRRRWHRGLAESLFANRGLFFNPRYGGVGWVGFPFFVICELLSPVVEMGGYAIFVLAIVFHAMNWPLALCFMACAILLGTVLSAGSLVLEGMTFHQYPRVRDTLILLLYAVGENFGYRQLHVLWRCLGLGDFLFRREGWGRIVRQAF